MGITGQEEPACSYWGTLAGDIPSRIQPALSADLGIPHACERRHIVIVFAAGYTRHAHTASDTRSNIVVTPNIVNGTVIEKNYVWPLREIDLLAP